MHGKTLSMSFGIVLLLVSALYTKTPATLGQVSSSTATHDVYSGQSIQEAINLAQSGDTVFVHNGTYDENVIVNETVSLIGENRNTTIIAGNGAGTVVSITADYVNVSGFTIQGGGWQSAALVEAKNCNFSENIIENNQGSNFALKLTACPDCIIEDNAIRDNPYADGIRAEYVEGCEIRRNVIANNGLNGIYFFWGYNSTLCDNIVTTNGWDGIRQEGSNNIILGNRIIGNGNNGISLGGTNNTICSNTITQNGNKGYAIDEDRHNIPVGNGISLGYVTGTGVDDNKIEENTITENAYDGILVYHSSSNLIRSNLIAGKGGPYYGIQIEKSSGNVVHHNNFVGETFQVGNYYMSGNIWDDDYPSGGNHWAGYAGVDEKNGLDQNETGSDGIGDTEYFIDGNNADNYPLIGVFSDFNATSEYLVQTICNSSISDFRSNGTSISFNVAGEDGTAGFCRICIPTALVNATYRVFVNGTEVPCSLLLCSNSTHSYLYFAYSHSTEQIIIVPEFPSFMVLPLLVLFTVLAVVLLQRRIQRNQKDNR